MPSHARDHLAVALDVPDLVAAESLIEGLDGAAGWLKVGSELYTSGGPAAVRAAARGARVFLDIKLHDIPNQVARSVRAAARQRVGMLTLHAAGGAAMLRAARDAAQSSADETGERPILVAVTVLTSLSPADLKELGIAAAGVDEQVARMAELAISCGIDGVVASPQEVARVRALAGDGFQIVTPGIRPKDWGGDDQKRTATVGEAIAAGSDLLVVGRPVTSEPDPGLAARRFVGEIERALAARSE